MYKFCHVTLTAIVAVLASTSIASAEKRTALVVGISAYDVPYLKLKNPSNDAILVSASLARSGFDVTTLVDSSRVMLVETVEQFSKASQDADVALFFFAGHGLQMDEQNYLVPRDAAISSRNDVAHTTVSANFVLRKLSENREGKISVLMLDACRNNPFALQLAQPGKEAANGLASQPVTGPGKYIVFSTDPGQVAFDGSGDNSPFAQALSIQLNRTKRPVTELISAVRRDVFVETGLKQTPWDNSSLLPPIIRLGSGVETEAPTPDIIIRELAAWQRTKSSQLPSDYLKYAAEFPDGAFVKFASLKALALTEFQAGRLTQGEIRPIRQRAAVLWVDDQPKRNVLEARKLVDEMSRYLELDVSIDAVTNTGDAIARARQQNYDAIISDMGRTEDGAYDVHAGYKLLEYIRLAGLSVPFVVYSSSRNPEHLREAEHRGAQGSTNDPLEMVWQIARALSHP